MATEPYDSYLAPAASAVFDPPPPGCMSSRDEFLVLSTAGDLYALNTTSLQARMVQSHLCDTMDYSTMAVSDNGGIVLGLGDGSIQFVSSEFECGEPIAALNDRTLSLGVLSYGMTLLKKGNERERVLFSETLSILASRSGTDSAMRLTEFDETTNTLRNGQLVPGLDCALELTTAPDGSLYGFQLGNYSRDQTILELDPQTAAIIQETSAGAGVGLGSVAIAATADFVYGFGAKMDDSHSFVVRMDRATHEVTHPSPIAFRATAAGWSNCPLRARD